MDRDFGHPWNPGRSPTTLLAQAVEYWSAELEAVRSSKKNWCCEIILAVIKTLSHFIGLGYLAISPVSFTLTHQSLSEEDIKESVTLFENNSRVLRPGYYPVCRVWQNSTRSCACKAVFRPLFLIFYLKNSCVHLPYSSDWGITVYLICAIIGLGWVK